MKQKVNFFSARQHALVTQVLIGVNVAIFIAGFLLARGGSGTGLGNRIAIEMATYGPAIRAGEWWRVVSGGFLHYGLIHIGFNMWLLYQVGGFLERTLGRVNFVLLYFASLIGGSLGAMALNPEGFHGGASGAVFGLMGAFTIAFWQRGVKLTQTPLFITLVLNLVITFGSGAVGGPISVGGHVGGLLVGGAVGAMLLRPVRPKLDRAGQLVAVAAIIASAALTVVFAHNDSSCNQVPDRRKFIEQGRVRNSELTCFADDGRALNASAGQFVVHMPARHGH
jgi:membrane associated rhomboid family serine protease